MSHLIQVVGILCIFLLLSCKSVSHEAGKDPAAQDNDRKDNERVESPDYTEEKSDEIFLDETELMITEPAPSEGIGFPARSEVAAHEADKLIKASSDMSASSREGGRPVVKVPESKLEPGQITAGEWNDLQNWDTWKELMENSDYNEMQNYWKIYPQARYTVFVTNDYEIPLSNVLVKLLDPSGNLLWTGRTDNAGRVDMWNDLFAPQRQFGRVDLNLSYGEHEMTIEDAKSIEEGVNRVIFDVECTTAPQADILLVVDATGSMGDEIRYLQTEFYDVIRRIQQGKRSLLIRTGAIFYRDEGDEYVTRTQGFRQDPGETMDFIAGQHAHGGGDYPEAVDLALQEALAQDWSEDAFARIIFLVLDAPPHNKTYEMDRIRKQIRDAAAEGIKIIPITASGINRPTEFLMKFMAIGTNGTYVFITDHSGIGGIHLEPVVQDYEVEKLNDLMVRLVENYTRSRGCNANEIASESIRIYPNPASNHVIIDTAVDLVKVKVLSSSGKSVLGTESLPAGSHKINLNSLIDGAYTIQCIAKDFEYSRTVILVAG